MAQVGFNNLGNNSWAYKMFHRSAQESALRSDEPSMSMNRSMFGRVITATAVIASSVLLGLPGTAMAAPDEGSISGTVQNEMNQPLENICVAVGNTSYGSTDATGDYSIQNVPVGSYQIQFTDCTGTQSYLTQWYEGAADQSAAQTVDVVVATETTLNTVKMQSGASISGTVRDVSNNGIKDICVDAHLGSPQNGGIGSAVTQGDGTYEMTGLPPGDVYVYFSDCAPSPRYFNEWYDDQRDSNNANALNVVAGSSNGSIDATLETGAMVSGTVTDESHQGLDNVSVSFDNNDTDTHGWAQTDASGKYAAMLEPGNYRVRFEDQNGSHATEYWNNQPTYDNADVLNVPDPSPIGNINAQLEPGAQISGTVTDPDGLPATDICVGALYGAGDNPSWLDGDQTDAAGKYTLSQLPAGEYRVYFHDCNDSGPYLDQFYNGRSSFSNAQILNLAVGEQRSGIGAQLVGASQIRGTVTDSVGSPLEGICVQATTPNAVGGMTHTESDGSYSIVLLAASDYKIQFVDCGISDDQGQSQSQNLVPGSGPRRHIPG